MKLNNSSAQLDTYYQQVQDIILNKQDWVTGLLPASTAVTVHGNYTDAWVRDNVYSILSAWGLALAYRRIDGAQDRTYVLEQSVVKLMRGLLTSMMRQAPKVEKFKQTQKPIDALHAKYDTKSGNCVVGDDEWGHLQLDATSLFLLMLAQMTESGLRIVFTIDEVNFVQNLVHYISRTYRTPDYGIWERGNKINHGIAELNASSIGMAKAALEALSGFNLFGKDGGQASIVHVISDDIARTRITLESLLPRESISKEVDSAVLSVTGFPAFAIDDEAIRLKTEALICQKLEGRYGCKRFLLDGHQTVIEDHNKLHYDPHELKQFMDIECEWPLFFTYLLLNNLCADNQVAAKEYRAKLEALLVEQNCQYLLPELYIVPADLIAAEKANPRSQDRIPNENVPLVWAQSLFMLGCLIQDGLLSCDDIDPLGRHKKLKNSQDYTIQIQLVSQDDEVQRRLREHNIETQTLAELAPFQIREATELSMAYTQVGRNDRIGLTGRPLRQLRSLATSKLYTLAGEPLIFTPQCLNQKGFYLAMDNHLLIQRLRVELSYIYRHWDKQGNPVVAMTIKHNMLDSRHSAILIDFINELQQGVTKGIPVKVGALKDFSETSNYEKINQLHDFRFSEAKWEDSERPFYQLLPTNDEPSFPLDILLLTEWEIASDSELFIQLNIHANLYAQLEILMLLTQRHGLDYETGLVNSEGKVATVADLLSELYERAGDQHEWSIVRRCAGLLGKYDINLEQAATEILVRQHALTLGRAYSGKATLNGPADSFEILQLIRTFNNNDASEHIIIQELIIYLGMLIKSKPLLFKDMHTIRVGHIMQLLIVRQKRDSGCDTLDQAFNELLSLSPFSLSKKLKETLDDFTNTEEELGLAENLHYEGSSRKLNHARFSVAMDPNNSQEIINWYDWREQQGSVGRETKAFYDSVWEILHHCKGLMMGGKLNSKNRLDSENTLSQMTEGEQSFKLVVNHLLNKIQAPVYRQLTVEALKVLALIFKDNPELQIDDTLLTDILIGHAVRLSWLQIHPEHSYSYDEQVSSAWQAFYQLPPHKVANGILDALIYLLENNQEAA
ncbi:MAG: glycoside hydrolase family 15 protein [Methylococcales bacterium]|nr:glycoside hydrolase family 15 protein [Methylococcales bacterium]